MTHPVPETRRATRTVGVDLAAQDAGTAIAVIVWSRGAAMLESVQLGVSDAEIVETAVGADKLGIDCPLGWPDEFVAFVRAHADIAVPKAPVDGGMPWRRTLAYRETDRQVHAQTGRWPLSVSTDRLGLTAMRCAGLLDRLKARGIDTDRAGDGRIAEVYPGGTLRRWEFDTTKYRVDAAARRTLLRRIVHRVPWLDVAEHAERMIASADVFDAVIAALGARAAALRLYDPPAPEHRERARREGWIALPHASLDALAPASG